MIRNLLQPKILLKNSLAAFLVITLSGAYCFFCCQEIKAATKTEHCPTSKITQTEHCNFSKKASEPLQAASINLFECCGLKFNFFVAKLEKNEKPEQTPALANNFFSFLESVKLARTANFADVSYRAPVFESRDLHVKNCVFRI
jgi:hypothetical protein